MKNSRGSILVTILVITTFLAVLVMSLMLVTSANLVRARARILQLQAQYSAESGADVAIAMLNDLSNPSAEIYSGTNNSEMQVLRNKQYRATFETTVTMGASGKERIITSTGRVYAPATATKPTHTRKIRVVAQRSAGSTASAMLSRTIIDVSSGVKNIFAKEVYVNDYIFLQKNGNFLTAENVKVAGKDATAQKCSITGDGDLQTPPTYTLPGYTRTKLNLAFNNCVPPGNNSNESFEITANDPSISHIQSMRIPWSQYMDASYLPAAAGNCSDWTTGTTVRQIPRVGNERMTHYPDSGSNVTASCGVDGSVDLGTNITYEIRDNVHIRASLCAAAACNPIFNNPTSGIHFVFVEGTINFDSIRTTAGSGPIVFVTYGADPASKLKECPHGGSLYLGKSNIETSARAAYLLATYGVCISKTKFAAPPSLGGVAGKSIFIASNSGNPWDLYLDPSFPVSQIPIDLSWRQVGYQRL